MEEEKSRDMRKIRVIQRILIACTYAVVIKYGPLFN